MFIVYVKHILYTCATYALYICFTHILNTYMFNTFFKQHKNTYNNNKLLPANLLKIYLQPIPKLDYN